MKKKVKDKIIVIFRFRFNKNCLLIGAFVYQTWMDW